MSTVSTITVAVLIAATLIIVFIITCTVCLRSRALRQQEREALAQALAEEALANISLYSASDEPPMFEAQVSAAARPSRRGAGGSKEKERMVSSPTVDWDNMMVCRFVDLGSARADLLSVAGVVQMGQPARNGGGRGRRCCSRTPCNASPSA